jgi:hypothetical protein
MYLCKYNFWGDIKASKDITGDMDCCNCFCFDPVTNRLIFNDNTANELLFYDADGFVYLGKIDSVPIDPVYPYSTFRRGVVNGELWIPNAQTLYAVDVASMTISRTYDLTQPNTGFTWMGGGMYDPIEHAWYNVLHAGHQPNSLAKFYLDRKTASGVTLASVVTDICQRCGLTAGQIDVSELTDIVEGYYIERRIAGRGAIETLMRGYFFDGVEYDGKIYFPKRGKASSASITEDELAAHPAGRKRPQEVERKRKQELELPEHIDVSHIDADEDYEVGNQYDRKLTGYAINKIQHRLPIVFTPDEAKQIACKHLMLGWISRDTYVVRLGIEYAYLNPTDTITITQGATTYFMRIDKIDYKNGYLEIKATAENTAAYSSDAVGAAVKTGTTAPRVVWEGPSDFIIKDMPMPKDMADYTGVYIAATGSRTDWHGAVVYKSDDDGITWTPYTTITKRTTIGAVYGVLDGIPDPWIWDKKNTLTVAPSYSGASLTSTTKLNVLNGSNAMLVGDEIIQYMTASENADGTYTISDLLRGRRGTEWAIWDHAPGESFMLLEETAGTVFKSLPLSDENIERTYAVVSLGMPFSSAQTVTVTPEFRTLMPYAPAHFESAVNSDHVFTWIRRTRRGGEWTDGHDVPLYEASESYELDIVDNDDTVVRTITSATETATWTAAQKAGDSLGSRTNILFGQTTQPDDGNRLIISGRNTVMRAELERDAAVKTLSLYVAIGATINVKGVIYSDTDGEPDRLIATTNALSAVVLGWNDFTFATEVDLTRGFYWLGVLSDGPFYVAYELYANDCCYCADNYATGPLTTFGSLTGEAQAFAMYAKSSVSKYLLTAKLYQISDEVGRGFPALLPFTIA